jgi:magnesium-transporting ATPase (P-type)
MIFPLTAISNDQPIQEFYNKGPKDPEKQFFSISNFAGLLGFGSIATILAYLSYIFYFQRISISPVNLTDFSVPIYHQATTQAFLTLCICSILFVFFERADTS